MKRILLSFHAASSTLAANAMPALALTTPVAMVFFVAKFTLCDVYPFERYVESLYYLFFYSKRVL